MKQSNNQIQSAIKYLISLLAFALPLFFLPITLEKFEFNKLSLLLVVTAAAFLLWGAQVIRDKKIEIAKTALNIPGMLFLGVILLASIFSIDKTSSLFGSQGRWFPSLVSLGALGAFYILIASNIRSRSDVKMILYGFLSGTLLATLIALLSYYGVALIPGSGNFFNPVGSLLGLGILASISCVAAIHELITGESPALKGFSLLVLLLNFSYIALYNKPITWILLGLGAVMVLLLTKIEKIKEQKLYLLLAGIVVTLVLGLTLTPLTKPVVVRAEYPAAIQLNLMESWKIAISSMRDFPLVGSGPSTFYLNYPRYRSVLMNQTDYWNTRFDKPFNEVLLVVGTLGLLGIALGIYLLVKTIKFTANNLKKGKLEKIVSIIALLMVTTLFLTTSTVILGFTLALMVALLAALVNVEEQKYLSFDAKGSKGSVEDTLSIVKDNSENSAFLTVIISLPLVAVAGLLFFSVYRMYPSEYYMQKAVDLLSTNAAGSFEYQTKAIRHNPRRSNYYNTFAQTNLAVAINLSQKENLTDTEREVMNNLILRSISASRLNTEEINKLNPANWEIRSSIYQAIRGAAEDANKWAVQSLMTAIQLDPNNPRLRVGLGGLYFAEEDYLTAANYFRQATDLKPDYANAYYNFAQAAKNLENYASAKRALELTLNLIPSDSEDYEIVQEEIEELNQILASLEPQEEKPTIEELERQAQIQEAEEITEQEPLTVEGENETVELPEGFEIEEEANEIEGVEEIEE